MIGPLISLKVCVIMCYETNILALSSQKKSYLFIETY
jgi:hypothetical protein